MLFFFDILLINIFCSFGWFINYILAIVTKTGARGLDILEQDNSFRYNNIEKVMAFSKFAIVFKLQNLQYRIKFHCSLQTQCN